MLEFEEDKTLSIIDSIGYYFAYSILFIIAFVVIYAFISSAAECRSRGGHFVKGLVTYECVD